MRKRSMASFLVVGIALAWLGTVTPAPARADDALPKPSTAAQPAAAGASGMEQHRLAALAGRWSVTQSVWADPVRPPMLDHGKATFTPVLGGRHLRQDLRIDAKDKPFEGVGYLGYDSSAGKYESLWMDVNFTGTILARGDYDPALRSYTFVGTMADPARRGATVALREVMHVQDADHFSRAYYERRGGTEALAVRLDYTRLK